jgi:glycosyltransferase involved in cell wall biosynthesis
VNDGSTDATSSILERFGESIEVIEQQNKGEAAAVNAGLAMAVGEYALVVSADDPLLSTELFTLSKNIFENNQEVVVTYPDWNLIDIFGKVQKEVRTSEFSLYVLLGLNKCIPGPGTIFRASHAKLIGGRNIELKFGSDYDFWLRLSRFGDFERIPSVLAQWRMHPNSTSIRSRGPAMAKERVSIISDFLTAVKVPTKLHRISMGNAYYSAAILGYFHPDVPYRQLLLLAFQTRRGWVENARVREVFYLLTLPFSEKIWKMLKRLFGLSDPQ